MTTEVDMCRVKMTKDGKSVPENNGFCIDRGRYCPLTITAVPFEQRTRDTHEVSISGQEIYQCTNYTVLDKKS